MKHLKYLPYLVIAFLCFSLCHVCYRTGYDKHLLEKFGIIKNDSTNKDVANTRNMEKNLLNFNNKPLEVVNDTFFLRGAKGFKSIVFLGNSLTYTDVPKEYSNKTKRGMASTSPEKDYVHQLVKMVAELTHKNIAYSVCNICDLERNAESFDIKTKLSGISISRPDYLIVQIGENVPSDVEMNILKNKYLQLLRCYSSSKKIVTLQFIHGSTYSEMYNISTDVAIETNSFLCDISHLYYGDNLAGAKMHYQVEGVDSHPSDKGMYEIAKVYYSMIKTIEANED